MTNSADFIWGVSTSSLQIEGGSNLSDRALSVWDSFCETPGRIADGNNALIASDHYNRMKEDVSIMKHLGIKAYRFSISWPRILPDGIGKPNLVGLAFYDRLIDELLKNNIQPFVTLFHWDLPYSLHIRGGWLNPDIPLWAEEYAKVIVSHFSDRVSNWITLNEPQCFINEGYGTGYQAPGFRVSNREMAQAVHNTLLAHGRMVQVIRQSSILPSKITFTQSTPMSSIPVTDNDIETARTRQFSLPDNFAGSGIIYTDPIYRGHYPKEYLERYESILPKFGQDDMKMISQPLDYFGLNLYPGDYVSTDVEGRPIVIANQQGLPKTAANWFIRPECMYWANKFCYERYSLPILITENGMSGNDWIHTDGKVHDQDRIDFIDRYISHMKNAIDEGVDIRGYFHWSLLDNFEWSRGYFERFGIVYVDYNTLDRTIKDSGYMYSKLISGCTSAI